jgi:hypothetical protein
VVVHLFKFENKTVVLAVPVYYGRIPELVVECFANMTPLAGGAFVAEHSYSTSDRPIAHDRPDEKDLNAVRGLAGLSGIN